MKLSSPRGFIICGRLVLPVENITVDIGANGDARVSGTVAFFAEIPDSPFMIVSEYGGRRLIVHGCAWTTEGALFGIGTPHVRHFAADALSIRQA